MVTITTSQAGVVTISGRGLKDEVKTLPSGMHKLKVALGQQGKAELKRAKKIKVSVKLRTRDETASRSKDIRL